MALSDHPNPLVSLPPSFSRWFGYRPPGYTPNKNNYQVWFWSFVGSFAGLAVIQAIFDNANYFISRNVPTIIASYGASAVLCFGAIEAPFSQPRSLLGGHFLSALIGVCITKLFLLLHNEARYLQLQWLAGCLSASTAIVVMQITETTHPPAGATALLAAVNPQITGLGWYYLPVVLLSSSLIFVIALLLNNIQRRYPVFWIKPAVPPKPKPADPVSEKVEPLTAASSIGVLHIASSFGMLQNASQTSTVTRNGDGSVNV